MIVSVINNSSILLTAYKKIIIFHVIVVVKKITIVEVNTHVEKNYKVIVKKGQIVIWLGTTFEQQITHKKSILNLFM